MCMKNWQANPGSRLHLLGDAIHISIFYICDHECCSFCHLCNCCNSSVIRPLNSIMVNIFVIDMITNRNWEHLPLLNIFNSLERIRINEIRSQAKVVGTLVTFGGALLMTLYKGPLIHLISSTNATQHGNAALSDKHWLAGTLLILVGCVSWSAFYILQV